MKIGDMVKASYVVDISKGKEYTGVIVDIEDVTDLFSEKYAITETNTYIRVLSKGTIQTFTLNEDQIEVVNESR